MTLFFLVVGLEARREVDLGDLRDRRRFVLPLAAGLLGMAIPVLIYLAITLAGPAAHGWGVAMSTDTALALGMLSLLGRRVPDRVRVFLLTVAVVDDLVALIVIAFAYSTDVRIMPIAIAVVVFGVLIAALKFGVDRPALYALLGIVMWAALLSSGVDPVVAGLAIGLTASAYSPARENLEQATGLFKLFREQPTPELARDATTGLTSTLSPPRASSISICRGRAISSCRFSGWPTRASSSTATFSYGPTPPRSRSAFFSAMCWESRSPFWACRGCCRG